MSVQADEVGFGVGDVDGFGDVGGGGMFGGDGVDAHPEAGGAGELDNPGGGETMEEIVLGLDGVVGGEEGADLDAPFAFGVGTGLGEGLDFDLRGAGPVDADGLGGGEREIENAARDKGTAIGDAGENRFAGSEIGDADGGSHGQGAVGDRDGVLVEDGAVGAGMVVVGRAVPGGQADFSGDGLAFGRVGMDGGRRNGCGGMGVGSGSARFGIVGFGGVGCGVGGVLGGLGLFVVTAGEEEGQDEEKECGGFEVSPLITVGL